MLSIYRLMHIDIAIVTQRLGPLYNVKTNTGTRISQYCSLAPLHFLVSSLFTSSGCGGIRRYVKRPLWMVEAAFMAPRSPSGPICGSIYQNNQTNSELRLDN